MTTVDAILASAEAAAEASDWTTAAALLSDVSATEKNLRLRGWYRSRAKQYADAIADYAELRRRSPKDYFPHYMLGYQYYEQQEWATAVEHFDNALALRPDHIKSLWRRAHALHRLGRGAKAAATANRLRQVWLALPEDQRHEDQRRYAQACHLIGRYQLERDPEGAIPLLREAVKHGPSEAYHYYQLAKALRMVGHAEEASRCIHKAGKLKPNDVSIELERAVQLDSSGHRDEAAAHLARIQRRCSGWFAYKAGKLAMNMDRPRLAVDLLGRAARHRDTRRERCVADALSEAQCRLKATIPDETPIEAREASRSVRTEPRLAGSPEPVQRSAPDGIGTVDVVRADRNFGFLVDDNDIRRHFRLPRDHTVHKGDRVVFTALMASKGPAARDVRPT